MRSSSVVCSTSGTTPTMRYSSQQPLQGHSLPRPVPGLLAAADTAREPPRRSVVPRNRVDHFGGLRSLDRVRCWLGHRCGAAARSLARPIAGRLVADPLLVPHVLHCVAGLQLSVDAVADLPTA